MLDRKWFTNFGPFATEFEQRVAERADSGHCVAVCNATTGLQIVAKALGLSGEVILPSFTFVATAHALQWHGITPVFCDVDPRTHNLDPERVDELVTSRTTAILGVHVWGRPCDVEALTEIARNHDLKLIFDAAHAFGSSYRGRMIGGFGDAEVFSFHATKVLNTFEGGAVATNDPHLASAVRLMTNFGFATQDTVVSVGTNGKMSEISAAMGLTVLESFETIVDANRRNLELYREELSEEPAFTVIEYDEDERSTYQYVVVEVDEESAGISRDELVEALWADNVRARRYFFPGCHRMEPYRTLYPEARLRLPHTEALASRVLTLPTGTAVGPADVRLICGLIRAAVKRARRRRRAPGFRAVSS